MIRKDGKGLDDVVLLILFSDHDRVLPVFPDLVADLSDMSSLDRTAQAIRRKVDQHQFIVDDILFQIRRVLRPYSHGAFQTLQFVRDPFGNDAFLFPDDQYFFTPQISLVVHV